MDHTIEGEGANVTGAEITLINLITRERKYIKLNTRVDKTAESHIYIHTIEEESTAAARDGCKDS